MDIGKFRKRVKILRYSEVAEVGGSNTYKIYTNIATLWGFVEMVKGLVRFDTKQIGEEVTHRIYVRYYHNISTENWVQIDDRQFRIRAVTNFDESTKYLELLCQEASLDIDEFEVGDDEVGEPIS